MKIRFKILLAMSLMIIATALILSVILYKTQEEALLKGIDSNLLTAAHFTKSILPEDYHDHIVDKHSVSDEDYLKIVDTYNQLCLELGLQYVWSVMSN